MKTKLEDYYTAQELADRFKLERRTIYKWHKNGRLRGVMFGRALRFAHSDVVEFESSLRELDDDK